MHPAQGVTSKMLLSQLFEQDAKKTLASALLSNRVSQQLLADWGYIASPVDPKEEQKLNRWARDFTIGENIVIRGASRQRQLHFQNLPLIKFCRYKLIQGGEVSIEDIKAVWLQFTNLYIQPRLYEDLGQLQTHTSTNHAIKIDVQRTRFEAEKDQQSLKSALTQVLTRYAIYNPFVGYCQGMSYIVAFLLEFGLSKEESFHMFCRISQSIMLPDFWISMNSSTAYVSIVFELLQVTHPAVHAKLKLFSEELGAGNIAVIHYIFQLLVCLFCVKSMSSDITALVLAFFMVEGVTALFKAFLALFDYLEPFIQQQTSFEEYNQKVEKQIYRFRGEKAIKVLHQRLVNTFIHDKLLSLWVDQVKSSRHANKTEQRAPAPQNIKGNIGQSRGCNRKAATCLLSPCYSAAQGAGEYFIFRTAAALQINDEYLDRSDHKRTFFSKARYRKQSEKLFIGRSEHLCEPEVRSEDLASIDSISQASLSNGANQLILSTADSVRSQKCLPKEKLKEQCKKFLKDQMGIESQLGEEISSDQDFGATDSEEDRGSRKSPERTESMAFMQAMIEKQTFENLLDLMTPKEINFVFQNGEKNQIGDFLKEDNDDQPEIVSVHTRIRRKDKKSLRDHTSY